MRSSSESFSCLNGTDWGITCRVGEGSEPLNLVTRWGSNSSNHFFSWLIKLAQQWGELLYKGSGSSALVGRFDWKSTLEVCCIVSAGLMLGPFVFFFNHYGFDLFVSGHGLIPRHSFLTHFWNLLLSKSLEGIRAPRCQMSPDSGRSLHGASQFQRAGLLPPTEHRVRFFFFQVCAVRLCAYSRQGNPNCSVLYPYVWPGCLGFTCSHSCILNICKQSCKYFSITES